MLYINPVVGMENGRGELCLIFKLTILDCFPIANPVKSLASFSQNPFCQNKRIPNLADCCNIAYSSNSNLQLTSHWENRIRVPLYSTEH